MAPTSSLWIVFTLAAALAQTGRNVMQRDLLRDLGAWGAAYVRFLYGAPFACVFLALAAIFTLETIKPLTFLTLLWTGLGAFAQIAATALMLKAMRWRSFVVVTAWVKTEPMLVALFSFACLNEQLSGRNWLAIALTVIGVLIASAPRRAERQTTSEPSVGLGSVWAGMGAAALFAISAVLFRAAVLALGQTYYAATAILALCLGFQCLGILFWLCFFDRGLGLKIARLWRQSLGAGFLGALGSQFWFLAFSLQSAARVRTLALVEILFAYGVSRRLLNQETSAIVFLGLALISVGIGLLLSA